MNAKVYVTYVCRAEARADGFDAEANAQVKR